MAAFVAPLPLVRGAAGVTHQQSPSPACSALSGAAMRSAALAPAPRVARTFFVGSTASFRPALRVAPAPATFSPVASGSGKPAEEDDVSLAPAEEVQQTAFKLFSLTAPLLLAAGSFDINSLATIGGVPLSVPITIGFAIAMEWVAQFLHGQIWHKWLYWVHESHHRPRKGPFEFNDVLAVVNAPIAIAMIWYGTKVAEGTFSGEVLLGIGAGMTMFGMAYLIFHDGYVHRRLPVQFFSRFEYFRRIREAHLVHHGESLGAEPYGFFLGPEELAAHKAKCEREEKTRAEQLRSRMAQDWLSPEEELALKRERVPEEVASRK
eukprot:tig00001187_g7466.t1